MRRVGISFDDCLVWAGEHARAIISTVAAILIGLNGGILADQ
jgi:hypothetical protein